MGSGGSSPLEQSNNASMSFTDTSLSAGTYTYYLKCMASFPYGAGIKNRSLLAMELKR